MFALASVKGGHRVDFTDIRQLAIKGLLDEYDAVVLNNTTNFQEAEAPGVSENLLAYVSNGGGDWCFRNEEPDHPLVASFKSLPTVFHLGDEIYMPPLRPLQGARAHLALPRRREHLRIKGLKWDPVAERVVGNDAAQKLTVVPHHNGWAR